MRLLEEGSHISARKVDLWPLRVIQLGDTLSLGCREIVDFDIRLIYCLI